MSNKGLLNGKFFPLSCEGRCHWRKPLIISHDSNDPLNPGLEPTGVSEYLHNFTGLYYPVHQISHMCCICVAQTSGRPATSPQHTHQFVQTWGASLLDAVPQQTAAYRRALATTLVTSAAAFSKCWSTISSVLSCAVNTRFKGYWGRGPRTDWMIDGEHLFHYIVISAWSSLTLKLFASSQLIYKMLMELSSG